MRTETSAAAIRWTGTLVALALTSISPRVLAQAQGTPIGVGDGAEQAPPSSAEPAPVPPPYSPGKEPAAPAPYVAEPAPEQSWPLRRGFTMELGLGAAYTAVSGSNTFDGGFGLAPLSLTLGGFVSKNVSLGARAAGTSFFEKGTRETVQVLNGFYGLALQVFLSDHVFVGGGAGLGILTANPFTGSTRGFPDPSVGFAMTGRAGFAFFAKRHHWLGVVIEAFPSFTGEGTAVGMSSILQWQYY